LLTVLFKCVQPKALDTSRQETPGHKPFDCSWC